ncbi:MAG: hypothetical protein A3I77_07595 [Gammaproteobacteria bacterium RIFCSPLOWO2_02_FULL_42_14]|nr:MAG: hypothetical protein A3B71_03425 [Gammaproteobacteria bacterium RIFCSPHIGHO2_02_FULL_42_43]OGT28612.1 MAG: hypothetical protein A2624_03575 [Gammaproteobacteria bacterium RIFCSPHIGHO2_01_FULL_42_8]OGT53018.1 MAG: hypothetical protein A3E54_08100 [Gammaproteobacteria bacterium RIFCSPHIGHO2_12_FULL_41_25]OGT61210.1 MAG: hypothetical protein A3I77_07595 [Gammaproteobacteria bacterium RIFCSPLOWO2_02_FULL_42_14]OGT87137.1 MAG: hypothetical protein A3G86_01315 [Gammaproteobacteria bacterium R
MNNTHEKQVLKLIKQKLTLRSSDLQAIGVPRVVLTRMVREGVLEKVSRGLYRKPNTFLSENETLVDIALVAPRAIFCLLSALQFHGLTTQLPREVWIAMPQGSRAPKMDYPPIRMMRFSGKTYSEGIQTVVRDRVALKIYSPAKTVVDCFKFRNKVGLDVALEALKDALKKKKATRDELYYFAKIERVIKIILPYLEAMSS